MIYILVPSSMVPVWFGLGASLDSFVFCPQEGGGLCIFLKRHHKVLVTCNPSQMRQTDYWRFQQLQHKEQWQREGGSENGAV